MQCLRSPGTFLALFIFCLTGVAHAQDASVIGTVTDDTKAVLPGATVTATGLETGAQTAAVTDGRGEYRLRMPAGKYKMQAELAGFGPVLDPARRTAGRPERDGADHAEARAGQRRR